MTRRKTLVMVDCIDLENSYYSKTCLKTTQKKTKKCFQDRFIAEHSAILSTFIKGDSNPNDKYFYQKGLYELWLLIQVSSKSVDKWGSYGHLKNSIWPTFSRHFEYLVSFQIFFNCLIFSYQYYQRICVSADMQLYT